MVTVCKFVSFFSKHHFHSSNKSPRISNFYVFKNKYSLLPEESFKLSHNDDKLNTFEVSKNKIALNSKRMALPAYLNSTLINVFFPKDFPYSVNYGFKDYSYYSFIQNTAVFAMLFIGSQIMIASLNLNISKSSGLFFSAGLTWVVKDGFGQIGN